VVVPRNPRDAKGLLLASIRDPNPVVFLEPKGLYRASVGEVPVGDFTVPLGQAEVVKEGKDVTIVGWGAQMRVLEKVPISPSSSFSYCYERSFLHLQSCINRQ
jgi:2-oxoisovalerate dehydrogenase E1 component beta subunit